MTLHRLAVAGAFALLNVAACGGDPGVVDSVPSGVTAGGKAPSTPASSSGTGTPAAGTTTPAAGSASTPARTTTTTTTPTASSTTTSGVSGAGSAATAASGAAGAAGSSSSTSASTTAASAGTGGSQTAATGGSGAAASSGAAAGGGAPAALPACPTNWVCKDPGKGIMDMTGFAGMVTDADGKAIAYACGNDSMPQIMCDPAMKGADCPKELTKPICSLIKIPGLVDDPLPNCAQLCSP
jgi:hypothetical protein